MHTRYLNDRQHHFSFIETLVGKCLTKPKTLITYSKYYPTADKVDKYIQVKSTVILVYYIYTDGSINPYSLRSQLLVYLSPVYPFENIVIVIMSLIFIINTIITVITCNKDNIVSTPIFKKSRKGEIRRGHERLWQLCTCRAILTTNLLGI